MKQLLTLIFMLLPFAAVPQKKDKNLPKGNEEFAAKNYAEAEANYRISKSGEPAASAAAYNLGNAIYRQSKPGEAKFAYMKAIENAATKEEKHKAYHNLGNAFMQEKNYQGAVDSYKNALRNNPYDDETRYNFALAKKMLKDNPPPPVDKKEDEKDDKQDKSQKPEDPNEGGKDDQKDKGDQGDQKDQKDKGEGDEKKDKAKKEEEKEQPGGNPAQQRMENLLDAMNNEEKKIQDKINAQKVKAQPKKQEKDW